MIERFQVISRPLRIMQKKNETKLNSNGQQTKKMPQIINSYEILSFLNYG